MASCSATRTASATPNAPSATMFITRAISIGSKPRAANSSARSARPFCNGRKADVIFPVIEARLRYKSPARYDDVLAIEVWPTLIERVRLNFGHRVTNQHGKLILEAETFHACTGIDEKPKRMPEELAEKLKPHLRISILIVIGIHLNPFLQRL